MLRRIATGLALALLVALPATAQDFQKATAAYKRGDNATALNEWRARAAKGDAHSQFVVGALHASGEGVPRDTAEAVKWYRKAAEQGLPEGQNNLGSLYDRGHGVAQDYGEAAKWYLKAAEQGYAQAQNNIGVMYGTGRGVPRDYAAAAKWFNRAVLQGNSRAQRNLSLLKANRGAAAKDSSPKAPPRKSSPRKSSSVGSRAGAPSTPAEKVIASPEPKLTTNVSKQPLKEPKLPAKSQTAAKRVSRASKTEKADMNANASTPAGAGFFIQLGSIKSDAPNVAGKEAARLTRVYKSTLGGQKVMAVRADLGARGIYHRFRGGPFAERTAADTLCRKLSARKQACFVTRR